MSTMSPPESPTFPEVRTQVSRALARSVEAVAFWLAIALPFLYFPLVLNGFTDQEAVAFAVLLAVNAVALVVGHDHRRDG